MANFFRGASNLFGLTPTDGAAYDEHCDEFGHCDEERFDDSYADSRRAECHRHELCEEAPREATSVNSREENHRYGKLHSITETKEPEQVSIKPESDLRDKYSKAPDIGSHFRDGDIVTFGLSELDPSETKRYVDFVIELVFDLRDRIKADGSVFTLYPHGCDISENRFDRVSG